jgi:hypothetical protein
MSTVPANPPRYTKEEHARRGNAIYERSIRSQVEPDHFGKIVAIDIETGTFELGDTPLVASRNLLTRVPAAQVWCVRVGHNGVYRFGSTIRPTASSEA